MKWVVDASVAAKWVIAESGSEAAQALLDDELVVPDLLFSECANVLWKKAQRGEITAALAETAAEALMAAGLDVFPSMPLTPLALQFAIRLGHPVYDCVYLALATQADATLITADRRLYARCRQADAQPLGLRVHLLGHPLSDTKTH